MFVIHNFSQKCLPFIAMFFVISADAATPFSQYGMIQNVQNYANNPFYNPNVAQITTPKIVYATGPALKPDDCNRAVQNIVETVCRNNNNCQNTTLSDVRPSIMIQLSTLPGNNYASSCSGYIDTIYENYKKRMGYSTYVPTTTGFPTTTTVASVETPKKSTYQSRAQELKSLQAANAIDTTVHDTDFPTTINDLSLSERANLQEVSYKNYMNANAYVPLNVTRSDPKSSDTISECEQIYNCIAQYDAAEKQAEEELFDIYNKIITQYADWDTATKSEDYAIFTSKSKQLADAMLNAAISPCTCTKDNKNQSKYITAMGIKSCDKNFVQEQGQLINDYINSGKIWK